MSPKPELRLPQELIESIIDLLSKDISTIRACALACWQFLPACRKHIFGDLVIASPTSNSDAIRRALAFFTTCPHITPYVTSVRLVDGEISTSLSSGWICREQSLPAMLNELSHLKKLSVESTFHPINWTHLPTATQKAFYQFFSSGTITHLALVMIDDFPMAAIRNLSGLRYLHLRSVSLKFSEDNIPRNECVPPKLRGLTIVDPGRSLSLLAVLLHDPEIAGLDFSSLLQLSVTTCGEFNRYQEDIALINRLLEWSSDSLSELELNPSLIFTENSNLSHYPLQLDFTPNLRTLKLSLEVSDLEGMGGNTSFAWLSHLFYNLPTINVIEKIILKCEIVQGNPFAEFDNTLWKQMDKVLTREELRCLREVSFLIHPIYSEARRYLPMFSDLLQQELQVLRERNILRVEEIYEIPRLCIDNLADFGNK